MSTAGTFKVAPTEQGLRLDVFLSKKGVASSRSRIKKMIDKDLVLVDGMNVKCSTLLKTGQIVSFESFREEPLRLESEDIPVEILYEDAFIVVVNKPAGLVVHPASGHRGGTLVNALLSKVRFSPIAGEIRPGIVHRLDKETSGVMVVAKDEYSLADLALQFKQRTVQKTYVALVIGDLREKTVSDKSIGWSKRHSKRMSVTEAGREALTYFEPLERYGYLTLVEARPKTGRTHQIRVHLANLGYPVVGDKLYLKGKMSLKIRDEEIRRRVESFPRHALHARMLKFRHPQGYSVEFEAPMPADMKDLKDFLKRMNK